MTEESVFLAALERTDPADRQAFLDQACAGDAALRQRIELLLAAYAAGQDKLEPPAPDQATTDAYYPAAGPGDVIAGRYKLLEQIGEGGMGEVWVAKQTEPVQRKVALKLIKPGMDSRAVLARFKQERQALALMDHPNIAKVLDGGLTATGRPFFVMELVNGLPLTKFCDDAKLTPRQHLELFVPVCQAVQHAHQKGIVHRDLKPSNVLVTLYDGKPVPKVIDFGVAKATAGKLTDASLSTQFGAVLGTLEYMAPEQAGFSALDVDTRADIYSLGVIRYELLTGLRPFDSQRLRKAALDEAVRILREEEPPRPSTRLSTDQSLPSLAAVRQTEPKRLMALMRGELDWVVMKCLEKDRNRRYETANGLARDVQRFLADDAVEARPPSTGYRLRKLARKYRKVLATVAFFAGLLVLAAVVSTWQAMRARAAEKEARAAEARAQDDRDRALQAEAEAKEQQQKVAAAEAATQREADKARAINQFLVADLLTQAEPDYNAPADRVPLLEVLDRAADKVGERFRDQPLLEATLRGTLGDVYHGLGAYDKAERHWSAALALRRRVPGADDLETYRAMSKLGHVLMHLHKPEESVALLRPAAEGLTRALGADHSDTLYANAALAYTYLNLRQLDEAIALCEQTLKRHKATLDSGDFVTLNWLMDCLALAYRHVGRLDKALPQAEQALEKTKATLGPDHPRTLKSMETLAEVYLAAGQSGKAQLLAEEMLEKMMAKFGPDHASTLMATTRLADAYRNAGQVDKALPLFEQILEKKKATLGPDHPSTLDAQWRLEVAHYTARQFDKSIPLFEEILRVRLARFGENHSETIHTALNLAVNYRAAQRLDEAIALFDEWLPRSRQQLGPDHRHTHYGLSNLAVTWVQMKAFDRAVPLYRELLAAQSRKLTGDDPDRANTLTSLGQCLLKAGKPADAEPVFRECLAIHDKKQPEDWRRFNTQSLLGGSLLGQQKYAEAEPLLLAGYEGLKQREAKIDAYFKVRLPEAAERLVQLYDTWGQKDKADEWRKQLEQVKAAAKPPDKP